MARQSILNVWLAERLAWLDAHFDEKYQAIFGLFLLPLFSAIFLLFISVWISMGDRPDMSLNQLYFPWPFWGVLISVYLMALCLWILVRNAGKTEINRRLTNIETKLGGIDKTNVLLEAIAKKLGVDVDAAMKVERGKDKES